ncbi:MAG: Gfo/Idh/MocA family oxidoreductase [Clostridiales bacterium]|nr:Gfo/Idh/MocA family oxidoreductase [Clostridiales bacterium]
MKKIRIAIAGLGSRGLDTYARCLEKYPERAELVAVADIRPEQVRAAAQRYQIPAEMCFDSVETMLKQPKLADVLFICTPDKLHYQPAVDALNLGYHLLLEKPAARSVAECRHIARLAEEKGLHVIVCHVLRYTVFYQTIRQLLQDGAVGEVMDVQAIERVANWHQAHSFVRGNWHVAADTTPMILAKCCHDMDMILWLTGKSCERVSSFGHLTHFTRANMPENAAERCGDDCPHADTCPYNAKRYYLEMFRRNGDSWPVNVVAPEPTEEKLIAALDAGLNEAGCDYGRCVYRMDNDVVDHQSVMLQLTDDVTVSFTMTAFTATGGRCIRICGTAGEIYADMERNVIRVQRFGQAGGLPAEEIDVRKLTDDFSGHGGGDARMVADYLDLLEGKGMSAALTTIGRSVESHYVALAAEESRVQGGRLIEMDAFVREAAGNG